MVDKGLREDLLPRPGEGVVRQTFRLLDDFAGDKLKGVEFVGLTKTEEYDYLRAVVVVNIFSTREERQAAADRVWKEFLGKYFRYLEANAELEGGDENWLEEFYLVELSGQALINVDRVTEPVYDEVMGLSQAVRQATNKVSTEVFGSG